MEEVGVKKQEIKGFSEAWKVALSGSILVGCLPILAFILFFLFIGVLFFAEDEQKPNGSMAYCNVTGEVNTGLVSNRFSNAGVFTGRQQLFITIADNYQIDPILMMAIALHETGNGTSNAVVNYNNPGGLMNPQTGKLFRFSSLEEGLGSMGNTLHNRIIKDGLTTIEALGSVYAPVGASNDPTGLNNHWVPNITKMVSELGGLILNCTPMDFGGQLTIPILGEPQITSPFGYRTHPIYGDLRLHAGIDFGCVMGMPIVSSMEGVVIYSENRASGWSTGWGNYILIQNGELSTIHAHLSKVNVSIGDPVKAGTIIGGCGNTGDSTGPHLHFETRVNGVPIDPYPYLFSGG